MSVDLLGNPDTPAGEPKKKKPLVRKHLVTTVYKKDVAEKLDLLHTAGHHILSITDSSEVRGFEIISYSMEE